MQYLKNKKYYWCYIIISCNVNIVLVGKGIPQWRMVEGSVTSPQSHI